MTNYRKSGEWTDQDRWYHGFAPDPDIDYDPVLAFAKDRYADEVSTNVTLDKKAEWFFGIAAGSIAGVFWISEQLQMDARLCLPSVVILLFSLYCSLRVKWPSVRAMPFPVRDAIAAAENREVLSAWMAASIHCAIAGLDILSDWKARQVSRAAFAIVLSIASLFIVYGLQLFIQIWGGPAS